jgi:hypothetical protein
MTDQQSKHDRAKASNAAQEKVNTERGGSTNALGDPNLKTTADQARAAAVPPAHVAPASVNNPAPGDPDPIYPGNGPGSPSQPTGELPPDDGSGYPSNPSVAGRDASARDEIKQKSDL